MRLEYFLDILHDTGEYVSFGIMSPQNPNNKNTPEKNPELVKDFKQILIKNGRSFHEIGGVFDGKKEVSFLIENIPFSDLEDLSEHFNQISFIYGKPSEKYNEEFVAEGGETKYEFQYWEYNNDKNEYELLDDTNFIRVDQSLTDNYSYFKMIKKNGH